MADDMKLTLDGEAVRSMTQRVLMESLTPEIREALIAQAINAMLIAPQTNSYGYKAESPMQMAFRSAINGVANEVAREIVAENPAVRERVREATLASLEKLLTGDLLRDALYESISTALRKDH